MSVQSPRTSPDLLPCPFCGFLPAMTVDLADWRIECLNDECAMMTADWSTPEYAVAAWNTRAPSTAMSRDLPTTSPAPWRAYACGWREMALHDARGGIIATHIPNPADARLMAAAPDLLAACADAIRLIETLPATLHDEEAYRVLKNLRIAYAYAEYSGDRTNNEG